MHAVTFSTYGGPEVLEVRDIEEPHAQEGQVRIAVRATGVNAIDWKLRSGLLRESRPMAFPAVDGREAAGVVDEVGPGVAGVAVGDEVFGLTVNGAAAEYAVLAGFAAKPAGLPWEEAAALPTASETSVRAFAALGGVHDGQKLLIDGAAGGVGSVAIQLARARGARVIGTASEANHEYLRSLGAEPVTYGVGLVERVRALSSDGVDLALDVAGHGEIRDLITLTGEPGHVVTIVDPAAVSLGVTFTSGAEGRSLSALGEAAALHAADRLQVTVQRTFPFSEAAEAHRASEAGHVRGKLVLVPA